MKECMQVIKEQLFHRYYKNLNDLQREAIFSVNGPTLVLAGAGSGKTTVLVNRISYLIKYGNAFYSDKEIAASEEEIRTLRFFLERKPVDYSILASLLAGFADQPCDPAHILAITFTNKAANEIKNRLVRELGDQASKIWAGTFHSVCVRILRMFSDSTEYGRDFLVYDQSDSKRIIQKILKEREIEDKEFTPRYVMSVISNAKNALQSPEEFKPLNQGSEKRRLCAEIYEAYQKELLSANAMDFDDLLFQTVKLLKENRDALAWCQNKFRYILVDEYQDTNHAQYLMIQMIAQAHNNIMVVGDDDQSIYKFRGAAVENILNFDKQFPNTKIIKLEQNYRSTQNILNAANAVIANNKSRKGKILWSDNEKGHRPNLIQLKDQEAEAVYIANKISSMVFFGQRKYRDIAVLYRAKAQANILETVFAKSGVPHRVLSGLRFYDHAEVKDMIAYLRLIKNPDDAVSLDRVINVPRRGIGQTTLEKIFSIAQEEGLSLSHVMQNASQWDELRRSAAKLKDFAKLMEELRSFSDCHLPSETVHYVIDKTGYMETLLGEENEERRKNVNELISSAVYYEERTDSPNLIGFLEEIALVSEVDNYDKDANSVVMMTIHAAKGLEFPIVFLVGMEENIFPSPQSTLSQSDLEEERRLFYVAMTRAEKELIMTCATQRMLYGNTGRNPISRFVEEIPEGYCIKELYQGPKPNPREQLYETKGFKPPVIHHVTTFDERPTPKPRPPIQASKKSEPARVFTSGDRVNHSIFGKGTVLEAKKYGSDIMYKVRFDLVGEKKLMATYAKLEPLQ